MRTEFGEEQGNEIRCHGLIGSAIRRARNIGREPQYLRLHWRDISTLHLQSGSHRSSLSSKIMVSTPVRVKASPPNLRRFSHFAKNIQCTINSVARHA